MIPAEAVEAAAKALHARECGFKDWNFFHPGRGMYEEIVRPILEAAAPRLLARAWEEGHDAGFTYGAFQGRVQDSPNPYGHTL